MGMSPTTTAKIERLHQSLQDELLENIAAANRHHARDPQRTLKLLQTA